jgi:hypothetical protein
MGPIGANSVSFWVGHSPLIGGRMFQARTVDGAITAEPVPPTPAPGDAPAPEPDKTSPDPTDLARIALLILILGAVLVAIIWNGWGSVAEPFKPSQEGVANFALFAGFYVAAQAIAALMALVSWLLPPWKAPATDKEGKALTPEVRAAYVKADRGILVLGISAVGGVAASCAFGLFFLEAVGIGASNTVDCFVSGLFIAGGAKPLHDFVGLIQKQNNPTTGTGLQGA